MVVGVVVVAAGSGSGSGSYDSSPMYLLLCSRHDQLEFKTLTYPHIYIVTRTPGMLSQARRGRVGRWGELCPHCQ